jgi:predicted ester cyclase
MDANESVVRDYLRARETADLDLLDRVVAPGFVHTMRGREQDRDGLFDEVRRIGSVYADMHHDIEVLFASGSQVACRYTFRARHVGPLPLAEPIASLYGSDVIEATGRSVTLTGMFVVEVRDGQLQHGSGEFDALNLLLQLGTFG